MTDIRWMYMEGSGGGGNTFPSSAFGNAKRNWIGLRTRLD